MGDEHERRRLAEWLRAEMARATGRAYRIDLDRLDTASLRELQRFPRDLDEQRQVVLPRRDLAVAPKSPRSWAWHGDDL